MANLLMNYHTLLADFLLGDRRTADRTDIQISIQPVTEVRPRLDSPGSAFIQFALPRTSPPFNYFLWSLRDSVVRIQCIHQLKDREASLTKVLSLLLRYFDAYNVVQLNSDVLLAIGNALKE